MQMSQFYTHENMMYSFYTLILYLFSTILWVNSMLNNVLFAFNSILILYSNILYLFYTLNNVLILNYTTCSKNGTRYMHMCTFTQLCMSDLISEKFIEHLAMLLTSTLAINS